MWVEGETSVWRGKGKETGGKKREGSVERTRERDDDDKRETCKLPKYIHAPEPFSRAQDLDLHQAVIQARHTNAHGETTTCAPWSEDDHRQHPHTPTHTDDEGFR